MNIENEVVNFTVRKFLGNIPFNCVLNCLVPGFVLLYGSYFNYPYIYLLCGGGFN